MLAAKLEDNAYDVALENFDSAADALGLDNDTREMIKFPERVLTVTVPVRMDDGHIHRFEAYRVRRRQGRNHLRSETHVARRARTHDAPLHQRDPAAHRPATGHSRA